MIFPPALRSLSTSPLLIAATLAACGSSQPPSPDPALENSDAFDGPADAVREAAEGQNLPPLGHAAEAFEAITEEAFTANEARLMALLDDAQRAVANLGGNADPALTKRLSQQIEAAAAAILAQEKPETAIAAIEGYRIAVEAAPHASNSSLAISLLDYAGFRIQADLSAEPVRWQDAGETLVFAGRQWQSIGEDLEDADLKARFADAIKDMQSAIDAQDMSGSLAATRKELELVDELETSSAWR